MSIIGQRTNKIKIVLSKNMILIASNTNLTENNLLIFLQLNNVTNKGKYILMQTKYSL
jgi:hypothetical protein